MSVAQMRACVRSKMVRLGLGLLVFGTGPLIGIIVAAQLGLWPDPNPNPIGPGLLAFLTFWPGVICLVVGVVNVWTGRGRSTS